MAGSSTPEGHMPKILAFSGSIRRDSWNRKLIRVAVDATRAAGGDVMLIDLADYPLPLYNSGLEGLPEDGRHLASVRDRPADGGADVLVPAQGGLVEWQHEVREQRLDQAL